MRPTTARTKRYLEALGYLVGHVEQYVPQIKRRKDLFGLADQVAVKPEYSFRLTRRLNHHPTVYVQSCAGARHAEHKRKMLANPNLEILKAAGNGVMLVSWSKRKRDGRLKWTPRVEWL